MVDLAEDDKIVLFDRHRAVVRSLPDAVAEAKPERLQELVALIVARVETKAQEVVRVAWTPPAQPFFAAAGAEYALFWRPRTGPMALGQRSRLTGSMNSSSYCLRPRCRLQTRC